MCDYIPIIYGLERGVGEVLNLWFYMGTFSNEL